MKIKLIDNAVDSIQITMELFSKYINCIEEYDNRYLKMTIIFLHNSIELLLKALLIQKDELLIYKDKEQTALEKAKAALDNSVSLDEYLIKDLNVQTIPYSELLDEYVHHFHCSEKVYNVLKLLGRYRNAITHFGIDKSDDVDRVMNVIYETFAFILYDLDNKLIDVHEYFEYYDMRDILEPLYEDGLTAQQKSSCKNPNKKIKKFTDMLANVINSEKFKNFIKEKNIEIKGIFTDYDNNDFSYELCNKEYKLYVDLVTDYKPYYNLTFFTEVEGYILFVVDHSNDTIYLLNDGLDNDIIYCDERQLIEEELKKGNCIKKPLTENNIRNRIIERLRQELNKQAMYSNKTD